jgi:hypothetical protein
VFDTFRSLKNQHFGDCSKVKQVNKKKYCLNLVRFEVFAALTMKNAVFWDVAPCIACVDRRFGGTYRVSSSNLKMEAIYSSETSVNTIYTRRHIPEDGLLYCLNHL